MRQDLDRLMQERGLAGTVVLANDRYSPAFHYVTGQKIHHGVYFRAAPPTSFAEVMQADKERFNRFFHAMLENGVYLAPSAYEAGFVSGAHGAAEIDATLAASRAAFKAAQT